MEEYPGLFSLVPEEKKWVVSQKASEDKKLELRLGPPGEFSDFNNCAAKRVFQDTVEAKNGEKNWSCGSKPPSGFQKISQQDQLLQSSDKRVCASSDCSPVSKNAAVNNSSNKRIALAPVVGWPPVRSFRKNLATGSLSKPSSDSQNKSPKEPIGSEPEISQNQLYVKINMEGVPIGRKINLSAYNSYEQLSFAINELFKGLLAAQRDSSATENENKVEEMKRTADSLCRNGEYTLVYEDHEGDRMLVGDVPWHMFVSTVKRLRVLKSSDLSTLRLGNSGQEKRTLDSAVENGR